MPWSYLAMIVHAHQSQRCPGELKGFEVQHRAASPLAFNGGFFSNTLGGTRGTAEHSHGVQGKAMENLDTAVMERKGKTCRQRNNNQSEPSKLRSLK